MVDLPAPFFPIRAILSVGLITNETLQRVLSVMKTIGFDLHIPVSNEDEIDVLLVGIQEFQEHLGGELCITLIDKIGGKHDVNSIDVPIMKKAVTSLNVELGKAEVDIADVKRKLLRHFEVLFEADIVQQKTPV